MVLQESIITEISFLHSQMNFNYGIYLQPSLAESSSFFVEILGLNPKATQNISQNKAWSHLLSGGHKAVLISMVSSWQPIAISKKKPLLWTKLKEVNSLLSNSHVLKPNAVLCYFVLLSLALKCLTNLFRSTKLLLGSCVLLGRGTKWNISYQTRNPRKTVVPRLKRILIFSWRIYVYKQAHSLLGHSQQEKRYH